MGFSLSWVAVAPSVEKALVERFGLTERDETAELAEFDLNGARLPGWYLLVADHSDALVDEQLLKDLSKHGRVIAAMVEEHVMCSSAEEWSNGERVWGLSHLSDAGILHLGVEGALPEAYHAIHQKQFDEQEKAGGKKADVDHIIDIPLDLAAAITGYRHDMEGPTFNEMEAAHELAAAEQRPIDGVSCDRGLDKRSSTSYQQERSNKPGFFARLFGRP